MRLCLGSRPAFVTLAIVFSACAQTPPQTANGGASEKTAADPTLISKAFKPFAANLLFTPTPGNRNVPVPRNKVFAQRSDGSYAERVWNLRSPAGEEGESAEIRDLTAGTLVWVYPFTKSVTTIYLSDQEIQAYLKNSGCKRQSIASTLADSREHAHAVMFGFEIINAAYKTTDHAEWFAPALNCFTLLYQTMWRTGPGEWRVVKIEVGDPPATLFETPSDYVERSPAEVESIFEAKYPDEVRKRGRPLLIPDLQVAQEHYLNRRQRPGK